MPTNSQCSSKEPRLTYQGSRRRSREPWTSQLSEITTIHLRCLLRAEAPLQVRIPAVTFPHFYNKLIWHCSTPSRQREEVSSYTATIWRARQLSGFECCKLLRARSQNIGSKRTISRSSDSPRARSS